MAALVVVHQEFRTSLIFNDFRAKSDISWVRAFFAQIPHGFRANSALNPHGFYIHSFRYLTKCRIRAELAQNPCRIRAKNVRTHEILDVARKSFKIRRVQNS